MTITGTHIRVERYKLVSFGPEESVGELHPHVHTHAHAHSADQQEPEAIMADQPEPPPPPPPPSFSEQQMNEAKQQAFQQGYASGKIDAEAAINKQAEAEAAAIKAVLDLISNRITIASETHTEYLKSQQEVMLRTILAVARKVAGDALKSEPHASVESLLRECVGLVAGTERVVVAVPPAKLEGLRQAIKLVREQLTGFQGELVIEPDANLGENDCRVEWNNGQAVRNTESLWAAIEALLRKTLLTQ